MGYTAIECNGCMAYSQSRTGLVKIRANALDRTRAIRGFSHSRCKRAFIKMDVKASIMRRAKKIFGARRKSAVSRCRRCRRSGVIDKDSKRVGRDQAEKLLSLRHYPPKACFTKGVPGYPRAPRKGMNVIDRCRSRNADLIRGAVEVACLRED
jgi:hypothetical protein